MAAVGSSTLVACDASEPDPADTTQSPESDSSEGRSAGTSEVVAKVEDVPVGGCAVFSSHQLVVTQPSEGDVRAFSAVCTHQGCPVSASTDGVVPCTCHGSEFSIEDGSVLRGPATAPLPAVDITVTQGSITLA